MSEPALAEIGHNKPPLDEFLRANELRESADNAPEITSEILAAWTARLIKQLTLCIKQLDETRLAETKPLRDATSEINKRYSPEIDDLKLVKTSVLDRLHKWRQRNKMPTVRDHETGAVAHSRTEHAFEVIDYGDLPLIVLTADDVIEAIDKEIRRLIRKTKGKTEIPGVRIWQVEKTEVR